MTAGASGIPAGIPEPDGGVPAGHERAPGFFRPEFRFGIPDWLPRDHRWWAVLVARAATLFVAWTAFRLAYAGSKGAALDAGLPEGDARWYPLCIEGVLVVAAVCTALLGGALPWVVLLSFSGLSVAANVVHAVDHVGVGRGPLGWFSLLVAAIPPAALPLCVHMAFGTGRAHEGRESTSNEHACEHGNEQSSEQRTEHPPLVLVSTPNEHDEQPPNEHPPAAETSTRAPRRVSTAARSRAGAGVSTRLVRCDPGCAVTDRAGRPCGGREVSPATRTRHKRATTAAS